MIILGWYLGIGLVFGVVIYFVVDHRQENRILGRQIYLSPVPTILASMLAWWIIGIVFLVTFVIRQGEKMHEALFD